MSSNNHNPRHMRLAIHYHEPIYYDGECYYTSQPFGLWIDSLIGYFDCSIILVAFTQKINCGYKIKNRNIELIDLGAKPVGIISRIVRSFHYCKVVKNSNKRFDYLGIRMPTPLGIYLAATYRNIPKFFLIVGDLRHLMLQSNLTFFKKYITFLYWFVDHKSYRLFSKNTLFFANSKSYIADYKELTDLRIIPTSTTSTDDIVQIPKKFNRSHFKLIYIGRMAEEKGLEYLIDAVYDLVKSNRVVYLDLVGVSNGDYSDKLKYIIERHAVGEYVRLINHVNEKDVLNKYLDQSSAMIIPSLWDSQPRSVWDGMARGLPILVSTGVQSFRFGYVPNSDMILFDTHSSSSIYNAVCMLLGSEELYTKLSKSSLDNISVRTLEHSASLLMNGVYAHYCEYVNCKS